MSLEEIQRNPFFIMKPDELLVGGASRAIPRENVSNYTEQFNTALSKFNSSKSIYPVAALSAMGHVTDEYGNTSTRIARWLQSYTPWGDLTSVHPAAITDLRLLTHRFRREEWNKIYEDIILQEITGFDKISIQKTPQIISLINVFQNNILIMGDSTEGDISTMLDKVIGLLSYIHRISIDNLINNLISMNILWIINDPFDSRFVRTLNGIPLMNNPLIQKLITAGLLIFTYPSNPIENVIGNRQFNIVISDYDTTLHRGLPGDLTNYQNVLYTLYTNSHGMFITTARGGESAEIKAFQIQTKMSSFSPLRQNFGKNKRKVKAGETIIGPYKKRLKVRRSRDGKLFIKYKSNRTGKMMTKYL